jgi:hypothetical protein
MISNERSFLALGPFVLAPAMSSDQTAFCKRLVFTLLAAVGKNLVEDSLNAITTLS